MLRHVLHDFVREDTLTAASAEMVNRHHELPLSAVHGTGTLSSSDAQRFGIRASSLLASYYPRYYGYYDKAIGIYTHISDQYGVYSTKVISCSPREALYVLDGLLNNNTILQIREHTTDTHGYTEIVFALCHLLGFYFMPRIRDLKDQQLYRLDRLVDYGVFTPLLTKTADLTMVEEQWDEMLRVALSLKQRTAPAQARQPPRGVASPVGRSGQHDATGRELLRGLQHTQHHQPAHAMPDEVHPVCVQARAVPRKALRILGQSGPHGWIRPARGAITAARDAPRHQPHHHTVRPQSMDQYDRFRFGHRNAAMRNAQAFWLS